MGKKLAGIRHLSICCLIQILDKADRGSYSSSMSTRAKAPPAVLHPIQIVTRRTGLSADVLRVWEKRYAVVTPVRSESGRHRLASDADTQRLRLLVQATRTGRTIGQVAALPTAALLTLLEEEAPTLHRPRLRAQADAA